MLFNSYGFLFAFLPVVLSGYHFLMVRRAGLALAWLTVASLVFYAWWRPVNVLLIAPSILINFGLARLLERTRDNKAATARALLIGGIVFNIGFLGYFKYMDFLCEAANDVFGTDFVLTRIVMPLGLSFITFQKIAFLVDVHGGRVPSFTFREYALFVLFFPQLIAGPIVHFRELMPRFRALPSRSGGEDVAVGLTLFFMGLAKKLVLADPMARVVAPLFEQAAQGGRLGLAEGWIAAVGFTLQIYFDFSGYSDMALGLARCFGIALPVNFNSPLKATGIVDFWRRWHISLTRFLTAYVFNPLSLRLTRARMAAGKPGFGGKETTLGAFLTLLVAPTMVTMLVSGVWHGAGYTFILWGLMHGAMISLNHGWHVLQPRVWPGARRHPLIMAAGGFVLTFLGVVFAMALFRAATVSAALSIWWGMVGAHGGGAMDGAEALKTAAWLAGLLAFALGAPNTMQILARFEPGIGVKPGKQEGTLVRRLGFGLTPWWALGTAAVALVGVLSLGELSEFLYWRF